VPHAPEFARLQFEPDEEQHHHDAEIGDLMDDVAVGHQAKTEGADQHAGGEIAQDRTEADGLAQGHQRHAGR
jgi:hypothetical protein